MCALVLGPIVRLEVEQLAQNLGDMSQAQTEAAKSFLVERLGLDPAELSQVEIVETCFAAGKDKLCVRFANRASIDVINRHKRNLKDGESVEDVIPPALQPLEDMLIAKGNKARASKNFGPPPKKKQKNLATWNKNPPS